jgi:RNA polymerase sigma-70 factor (ECF subfamily)
LEDKAIVDLYWQRSDRAIPETECKYGGYCHAIAYGILSDREDAKESVNDTYLDAWNAMPPHRPGLLSAFLGKITRRIAIDRWRRKHAGKRGGGEMPLVLEELADCIADTSDVEAAIEKQEAARIISEFLASLPITERRVFLRRYWYLHAVADIARDFSCSESRITSMLHRTRAKLRQKLESEGYL